MTQGSGPLERRGLVKLVSAATGGGLVPPVPDPFFLPQEQAGAEKGEQYKKLSH